MIFQLVVPTPCGPVSLTLGGTGNSHITTAVTTEISSSSIASVKAAQFSGGAASPTPSSPARSAEHAVTGKVRQCGCQLRIRVPMEAAASTSEAAAERMAVSPAVQVKHPQSAAARL